MIDIATSIIRVFLLFRFCTLKPLFLCFQAHSRAQHGTRGVQQRSTPTSHHASPPSPPHRRLRPALMTNTFAGPTAGRAYA